MTGVPADAAVRERALEPSRSFLVQAPAGSGKTELLIQRYLRLLGDARAPEEVLAITFTRKAAAEMRSRVLAALNSAARDTEPEAPHLRTGFRLATEVMARDARFGWGLREQPARLRIGTIDSVNAWLAARTPFSAGGAALLEVTEDAQALYDEAARDTVGLIAEPDELGAAVRELLAHVDNRAETLCSMLTGMLARRDQWLRHLGAGPGDEATGLRRLLETSLGRLVERHLAATAAEFDAPLRGRTLEIMRHAAAALAGNGQGDGDLLVWRTLTDFPGARAGDVGAWRGLAGILLTKDGRLRKSVNKLQGFGTGDRDMKARCQALLADLAEREPLVEALATAARLPDPRYADAQWAVLRALLDVLPVAAAQLRQVFARHGQADFGQVASDALAALGRADDPSEIGLVLDYRLQHILMDEFQDTSRSQYDLLRALTAGWTPGDGRSLFLVGDPMQSIYRFREADVGLFLGLEQHGLGDLPIEFLRLESNFRSDPAIVDWVNATFSRVLPAQADPWLGAVPFRACRAEQAPTDDAGVSWIASAAGDDQGEAQRLAELVDDLSRRDPTGTIGILVRSRAHARLLLPELRRTGVAFAAPELESLHEEPAVQDLLALTRALLHEGDRIAWLALLRGPCCGLTLEDLHALAGGDRDASIRELLHRDDRLALLSGDGRSRATGLRDALEPWLHRRGACSLRELVQGCWMWIGGPATLDDAAELEVTDAFFDFLATQDTGGDLPDIAHLHTQLERHAMRRGGSDARVQVMTMHKAKGLEFDSVLLPGLARTTRGDSRPPLLWQELADDPAGATELVLAPINARGGDRDLLFELLWRDQLQRGALERERLLYVATTRARRRLFLFADVGEQADGRRRAPAPGSLLASLWPHCAAEVPAPPAGGSEAGERTGPQWVEVPLRRLAAGWQMPRELASRPPHWPALRRDDAPEFEWAGRWTRHVGTVVHRWLQEFSHWPEQRLRDDGALSGLGPLVERQLQRLGVGSGELERARDRALAALRACLADPRGRWILSDMHEQAVAELAVVTVDAPGFRALRVDRSFVAADGVRWIIDYKTGAHEGRDLDAFLASEVDRYRAQLRDYRDALRQLEPERPIRTALYFPLLQRFEEVDVDAMPGTATPPREADTGTSE